MGIVGKYIDDCSNEQRDRIIEAQNWTMDNAWFVNEDGCTKCLCGHAENWYRNEFGGQDSVDRYTRIYDYNDRVAYNRFPQLVERFGVGRILP